MHTDIHQSYIKDFGVDDKDLVWGIFLIELFFFIFALTFHAISSQNQLDVLKEKNIRNQSGYVGYQRFLHRVGLAELCTHARLLL